MPNRRYRSTSRRTGRSNWTVDGIDPATLTQGQQGITQLQSGITADVRAGSTIQRIVGTFAARAVTDDVDAVVSFYLGLINQDAFVGGAVPDIRADDFDYMFQKQLYLNFGSLAGNTDKLKTLDFDIRSKRRIRNDTSFLCLVAENISSVATSLVYLFNLRSLIRIP